MGGIHHSTRMVSSGSLCFLVVLDPESEDLNEMNIGSIGNVLGNVNDAGSGSDTMHQGPGGTSMFSGGESFGGGNHFSMQSGGGSFGRGSGSGSGFGFNSGFNSGLENQESFGAFRSGGNFRRRSSGSVGGGSFGGGSFGGGSFGGGSFGGGSFDGGNS